MVSSWGLLVILLASVAAAPAPQDTVTIEAEQTISHTYDLSARGGSSTPPNRPPSPAAGPSKNPKRPLSPNADQSTTKKPRPPTQYVVLPLTNTNNHYSLPLHIGTPGQTYQLLLDSGSAKDWLTVHPGSTSYHVTGKSEILSFGSGPVNGQWATDTFTLGRGTSAVSLPKHPFLSRKQGDKGARMPDGIAGLAGFSRTAKQTAKESTPPTPPFWESFVNGLAPERRMFAVHLKGSDTPAAAPGGQLTIGGYNPSCIAPGAKIAWTKPRDNRMWLMYFDGATLGDKEVARPGTSMHVDTGSSSITVPWQDAKAIYDLIDPSWKISTRLKGRVEIPCNTQVELSLRIGGSKFTLPAASFVKPIPGVPNRCYGAVVPRSADSAKNYWTVGSNFLQHVYTVFSIQHKSVGFAPLAQSPCTDTSHILPAVRQSTPPAAPPQGGSSSKGTKGTKGTKEPSAP